MTSRIYVEVNEKSNIESDELLFRADEAFENNEFIVVYQPKFDIRTLHTVGAEALVRWQLPNGQLVPPSQFIDAFEASGHIEKLDFLVLEKTCQMLAHTIHSGIVPMPVSVNFSRLHIHTPNFVERLHEIVQSYKVPTTLIEIEFTESAFINDVPPLDRLIEELHDHGYTVAMDDFGTGFSSLNELMNLNVDVLKLDRAFLKLTSQNENRAACIIQSIVRMAHALGIQVVAEGVEDNRGLEILRQCGCNAGQGYFYSKPVTEEQYLVSFVRPAIAV